MIGEESDDETNHESQMLAIEILNEIDAAKISFKNHTVTTDSENDLVTDALN